jgi:hypothetical protein
MIIILVITNYPLKFSETANTTAVHPPEKSVFWTATYPDSNNDIS